MKYFILILMVLAFSGCSSPGSSMEQLELPTAMDLRQEREMKMQASAEAQAQKEGIQTETSGVQNG